jgi:hypothetical protein
MKVKKSQEKVSTKKRISVQAAKSKGRNLQKLVAKKISELLNEPFGPDEDIASRPMGQSGCDTRLSSRIRKLFPYSVECKCQERFNVVEALKQAIENKMEGTEWLLVYTKNRFPTIVSIDIDHFFDLLSPKHCPDLRGLRPFFTVKRGGSASHATSLANPPAPYIASCFIIVPHFSFPKPQICIAFLCVIV